MTGDRANSDSSSGSDVSSWGAVGFASGLWGFTDYYWPIATHPSLFTRGTLGLAALGLLALVAWVGLAIWNLQTKPWRRPMPDAVLIATALLGIFVCVGSWPNQNPPSRSQIKEIRLERQQQFDNGA